MMHTKEPWTVSALRTHVYSTGDEDMATICRFFDANGNDFDNSDHNAQRIVACVNAYKGIPTDRLDGLKVPLMQHLFGADEHAARLVKQRDDLLAALRDLLHAFPSDYIDPPMHITKARAAIVKAEAT